MTGNAPPERAAKRAYLSRDVLDAVAAAVHATPARPVVLAIDPVEHPDLLADSTAGLAQPASGFVALKQQGRWFIPVHYDTGQALIKDLRVLYGDADLVRPSTERLVVKETAGVVIVYPATGERDIAGPPATGERDIAGPPATGDPDLPDDLFPGADSVLKAINDRAFPEPAPAAADASERRTARKIVDEPYRSRLETLRQEIDADFARTRRGRRRSPA